MCALRTVVGHEEGRKYNESRSLYSEERETSLVSLFWASDLGLGLCHISELHCEFLGLRRLEKQRIQCVKRIYWQ